MSLNEQKKEDFNYKMQYRVDIQDFKGINKIVKGSLKFREIEERVQKKLHIETEDGYWIPIKKVEIKKHNDFVYNFEVENEHTYVTDFIATHNCTAFGSALEWAGYLDKLNVMPRKEMKSVVQQREQINKAKVLNRGFIPLQKKRK